MTLEIRSGHLVVTQVRASSPAATAGILAGDTVIAIDDQSLIDLDPLSPEGAIDRITKEGRAEARLLVGRGSGILGVTLPLRESGTPPPAGPPGPGDAAPLFTGRDLHGEEVSLQSLRGRAVLIDFWAAWCLPCRDIAIPLRRLAQTYGDHLAVVGVSLDTDPKAFEAFVYNHHLPGRQILDGGGFDGRIGSLYGVRQTGIPYAVLVDPRGTVVSTGGSPGELEPAIRRLAGD
jgi:thiol-disulfide isomerase/thioredoxin